MKKFIDQVGIACNSALASVGFQIPRRTTRLIPISDDLYGWVGLNRYKAGDAWRINPFIGLHSVSVMRRWFELSTRPKLRYLFGEVATAAVHLGELAPDIDGFCFEQAQPLDDEARRLADAVVKHGLPWMHEHASLEALLVLFKEREEMLGGYPERIAVALFLLGRYADLAEYLDVRLETYARQPAWGEVHASWKEFSEALRSRLP
jgi:hypothetical protein